MTHPSTISFITPTILDINAAIILGVSVKTSESAPDPFWPWQRKWWKPKDPRRDLVRAGALIIAEIERIDRAAVASLSQQDQQQ